MIDLLDLHLQACTDVAKRDASIDPRTGYAASTTTPLAAYSYLDKFSFAVHGFLTPSQVPEAVHRVISKLSDALDSFRESDSETLADGGDGARKRRKGPGLEKTARSHIDSESRACDVSLLSKIVALVLASSPLRMLQDEVRQDVLKAIHLSHTSLQVALMQGLKHLRPESRADTWAWEIVLVAVLWLRYQLSGAPQLQIPIEHEEAALSHMTELLRVDALLPELRVAMVRCESHVHGPF